MNREELINAALEHQSKFETCDDEGTLVGFANGMHKQSYESFIAGAEWQSKQSPWISVEERLPEKDGYYLVTDGENVGTVYFFKEWNKFAVYEKYPHPFYKDGVIKLYMPIPSFDQILEANKDVLQRMKEKGD